jgi:hypothetical protein
VDLTATGGTLNASYTTLKGAFDAINLGTHTGIITIGISGNTSETVAAVLNASGSGAASYTSLTISPSGGAARTISGAMAAGSPLIDLNGADNVTVNGLNTGGNALTLSNTTVSTTSGTSTIRFIADATNNTITNCTIQGSFSSFNGNGANILFSTGTTTGNDNNSISNCNIGPSGANLPTKCIYGNGSQTTTAIGNSGISITNNDIHDFFAAAVSSSGIATNGGCNTWTIINNRFYQTGTRTWTSGVANIAIDIRPAAATHGAQGFTITGNIIGYATNSQTGTYTLTGSTGRFTGIQFVGIPGAAASTINNNTIAAVSLSGVTSSGTGNSSPLMGIFVSSGVVTTNGNTVGSQLATGSLIFSTNTTSSTEINGIANIGNDSWTANSNNIGGISVTNAGVSGTFIIYGLRSNASTGINFNAASNTIGGTVANSIQLNATGTSSQLIGMQNAAAAANWTLNTIRNLTTNIGIGTATGSSVIGMNFTNTTSSHNLSQNTIFNLSNTNATDASVVTGIQFTGSTANLVERNLIYGLTVSTNSFTAEINGIRVEDGTTTWRNNMIALGAGVNNAIGAGSATGGISGINEPAGTDNFYHNSVYIGGSPTAGSGPSYAFNSSQTVNTRDFRDNIFVNARNNSGATGKNYIVSVGGTVPNPAGLTINYNVYYQTGSGAVFGYYNSLDMANLAAWQIAVGQDAASISGNPAYNGPANSVPDLHIHPSNISVAEGTGFNLGITDDYDGQTRAGLTPVDIGADAGNFTGAANMTYVSSTTTQTITSAVNSNSTNQQVIGIQIVTTGFVNVLSATSFTINTNGTTNVADITNARLWYTGTSSSFGTTTQFGSTTGSPSGSFNITGSQTLAEGTNYFWLTYDIPCGAIAANMIDAECNSLTAGVAHIPTVQAPAGSRTIVTGPLSGTKTVGSGGDFATLTAAAAAVNSGGLSGNTTLSILNNLTESGAVIFNQRTDCNAGAYTLTIKPAAATSPSVTANSPTAVIILNGADRVIIDGSNTVGGTTRNLSIINTNTGTSSAVVAIISLGAGLGATNNVVKNTNLAGTTVTATDGTVFAVFSGGSTISVYSLGDDNDNNTIQNNNITKTQVGIYSGGGSAANKNTGTVITQNSMNAASPNNLNTGGIYLSFEDGAQVTQNDISVLRNDGVTGQGGTAFGIALGVVPGGTTTSFTGNDVTGSTVSRNKINGVTQLDPIGYSAFGIVVNSVTSGTNLVANNMISGVNAASTDPDFAAGIVAGGGTGSVTNIYYNTVVMTGSRNAADFPSYGLAISGGDPVVDIRNNIFRNIQTSTGIAKMYAIGTGSSTFANMTSNYNDFTVSGASGFVGQTGGLGITGTDRLTLANWQTATAKDANTITITPVFVSATDLHLIAASNCNLHRKGIPVSGTTVDFDGELRHTVKPDIGADEYSINVTGTVTWTGAVSNDWFDVRNWNLCELPGTTSDVVINGAMPNYPLVTANVIIKSLTLHTGASIIVATGVDLKLTGP